MQAALPNAKRRWCWRSATFRLSIVSDLNSLICSRWSSSELRDSIISGAMALRSVVAWRNNWILDQQDPVVIWTPALAAH